MSKRLALVALALSLSVATSARAVAGQTPGKASTLTEKDRADIQQLVASYARSLGTCAAEDYANNFEPVTGFFESQSRGRVMGKARLIALVKSEGHCDEGNRASLSSRPAATAEIEVSERGVTGKVPQGGGGRYEDVYVKTKDGWRFKSRNNVSKEAVAAQFTYQDFAQIHDLGGDRDQFEDVYIKTQKGPVVFRSGGMTIVPSSGQEAKARVHLKGDDGRYEDVYVKGAKGWRFQSRTYVPTDDVLPFTSGPR